MRAGGGGDRDQVRSLSTVVIVRWTCVVLLISSALDGWMGGLTDDSFTQADNSVVVATDSSAWLSFYKLMSGCMRCDARC